MDGTQLQQVAPESGLGKALAYTDKLKDKLRHYCEDGDLPMSNQVAENAIPLCHRTQELPFLRHASGCHSKCESV
jgi:hypothetical protein